MSKHLQRDLDELKRDILTMGGMVEDMVRRAISALCRSDRQLADQVIRQDEEIDAREVQVEEECLKILALHQPVAGDLRFVVAVAKINNDLERMADLAVNIAELAAFLATHASATWLEQLEEITDAALKMVRESLDAFVNLNADKARQVLAQDDYVDELNRDIIAIVVQAMQRDPHTVQRLIRLFSVSRHVERIADHATNIAEDVIYMVEGEIVRHQAERG